MSCYFVPCNLVRQFHVLRILMSVVFSAPGDKIKYMVHVQPGALKMLDVKMTDVKLTDQFAGHEIAGHEIEGPMCTA